VCLSAVSRLWTVESGRNAPNSSCTRFVHQHGQLYAIVKNLTDYFVAINALRVYGEFEINAFAITRNCKPLISNALVKLDVSSYFSAVARLCPTATLSIYSNQQISN